MDRRTRKSGLDIIGELPWGTHLCHFYSCLEDVAEVLVPFFRAGLEGNERCMWVAADPSAAQQARLSLASAVSDLGYFDQKGQVEVLDASRLYAKSRRFEPSTVLRAWAQRNERAMKAGFDGLRVVEDTSWVGKEDWEAFAHCEAEINRSIGQYPMTAICAYPLGDCEPGDIMDVVRNHRGAVVRRHGQWAVIDSVEYEKAAARPAHEFSERVKELNCLCGISNLSTAHNMSFEELLQKVCLLLPPSWRYPEVACARVLIDGQEFRTENFKEAPWKLTADIVADGRRRGAVEVRYLEQRPATHDGPFLQEERNLLNAIAQQLGQIAERKQAEEAVRLSEKRFRDLYEGAPLAYFTAGMDGGIWSVNRRAAELLGYEKEELVGRPVLDLYADTASGKQKAAELLLNFLSGHPIRGEELEMRKADGSSVWVSLAVTKVLDPAGSMLHTRFMVQDITRRKQFEEQLRRQAIQLRNLSRRVVAAQEAERRTIALELHDEFGQKLTALKLLLGEDLLKEPKEPAGRLTEARALVDDLISRTRELSLDLRPGALDDLGLLPAILQQVQRFSVHSGLRVDLKHSGMDRRFSPEVETNAYRILQEALTNVVRHSGVHEAIVRLWANPNILFLQVEDQGVGFDSAAVDGRAETIGLSGIRERVDAVGGRLEIESAPGAGTRLTVEMPLDGKEAGGQP